MATSLEDLVARIRLDTTELQEGASRAAAFGGAIGGALGSLAASGLSAAASSISDFVTGSVAGFSELEDSTAAAEVVFGSAMGTIIDQSKTAAGTLGLSSQQVINAANTFGTYGKAAGLVGEDLAGFSTQLTALAGDMASFKGTSTEQAIEAVGAALRGETEPIRAYGVLLDDATLKAEAMAMGIYQGTGPLTAQQKVLAAQSSILKQTSDAQGDFARTSESTANVQKTLAAETENLQAKFGTLLAPAFTAARSAGIDFVTGLSGSLDTIIPKFEAFQARASSAVEGLKALFSSGDITAALTSGLGVEEDSPVIGFLMGMRDAGLELGAAFQGVWPQITAALAPVGEAVAALAPTFASLIPTVLQVASAFNPVSLIIKSILPILPQLAATFSTVLTSILSAVTPLIPIIQQLVTMLAGQLGSTVQMLAPIIAQLATTVGGILGNALQIILPVIMELAGMLAQLLPPIMGLIGPLLQLVMSALMPLLEIVGQLISAILPPLLDLFMAILEPVIELVAQLATALAPILTLVADLIGSVLAPILSTLIGWIGDLIGWVLRLVGPALGGLVNILSNVIGWISNVIGSIANWLASIGGVSGAIDGMKNAVSTGVQNVVTFFKELPGKVLDAIGTLASKMVNVGKDIVQGLIDGVKNMASRAVQEVKDLGNDLVGGIKGILGISSPSKEFRKIGAWTAEGLALGIADQTSAVAAAAQDMATAVDVPMPDLTAGYNVNGTAGYGNGYGAGSPPPIAVGVRVFLGDREVTDLVRTEVYDVLDSEASAIVSGVTSA